MLLSLTTNLGLLGYFKYTNFFLGIFNSIAGNDFQPLDIFLPVGVSFFTFQSLSYTIDVYRGNLKPVDSILDYAFYLSFFPQLVAGPIVRAAEFLPQIHQPTMITKEMFGRGVYLICTGLFKKAVISNYISLNFVDRIFDAPTLYTGLEKSLWRLWICASDLLRFLRLQRYGNRNSSVVGVQVQLKLRFALSIQKYY